MDNTAEILAEGLTGFILTGNINDMDGVELEIEDRFIFMKIILSNEVWGLPGSYLGRICRIIDEDGTEYYGKLHIIDRKILTFKRLHFLEDENVGFR